MGRERKCSKRNTRRKRSKNLFSRWPRAQLNCNKTFHCSNHSAAIARVLKLLLLLEEVCSDQSLTSEGKDLLQIYCLLNSRGLRSRPRGHLLLLMLVVRVTSLSKIQPLSWGQNWSLSTPPLWRDLDSYQTSWSPTKNFFSLMMSIEEDPSPQLRNEVLWIHLPSQVRCLNSFQVLLLPWVQSITLKIWALGNRWQVAQSQEVEY